MYNSVVQELQRSSAAGRVRSLSNPRYSVRDLKQLVVETERWWENTGNAHTIRHVSDVQTAESLESDSSPITAPMH
jgi:hypothetical protein